MIGREMGESVKLVNPAYETAKSLKDLLKEKDLLNVSGEKTEQNFLSVMAWISSAPLPIPFCHIRWKIQRW